jgi:hypothetical protein
LRKFKLTSMKKILSTLVLLALLQTAFAQFNQGRVFLGGQTGLDFSSTKTSYDGTDLSKESSFSLSPHVGYFVADHIALGASIDLSTDKSTDEIDDTEFTTTSIMFSPFVRYYLDKGLFGEFSIGFGSAKEKFDGEEDKAGLFGWSLGIGYAAMLNDKVAIEPMIGYASVSSDIDGLDEKMKTSGLMLSVGVSVYLGGD